jgi:hypothetical protein
VPSRPPAAAPKRPPRPAQSQSLSTPSRQPKPQKHPHPRPMHRLPPQPPFLLPQTRPRHRPPHVRHRPKALNSVARLALRFAAVRAWPRVTRLDGGAEGNRRTRGWFDHVEPVFQLRRRAPYPPVFCGKSVEVHEKIGHNFRRDAEKRKRVRKSIKTKEIRFTMGVGLFPSAPSAWRTRKPKL